MVLGKKNVLRSLTCCFVLLSTASIGQDFEGEFTADKLPEDLTSKIVRRNSGGFPWTAFVASSPKDQEQNVVLSISVQHRSMPTHAHRVAATKGYVNGNASILADAGFRAVNTPAFELEDTDFTQRHTYKIDFQNAGGERRYLGLQVWFDNNRGTSGMVLTTSEERRETYLRWLQTVRLASHKEEAREWKSKSGYRVRARFRFYENGQVTLLRDDGKHVRVALREFSSADQKYLGQHGIIPVEVFNKEKTLGLALPLGFAEAASISKGASVFRHLDGTTVEVAMTPWPAEYAADAKSLIEKAPDVGNVTPLAGTPFYVADATEDGRSKRFYAAKQGELTAVMIVDAADAEKRRQHTAAFDQAARSLRRVNAN